MSLSVRTEEITVKMEEDPDVVEMIDENKFIPSETTDLTIIPTKKKRIRKRRLIALLPMPRIPRSDIRRQYARMFSNVYNSCDFELMNQYLKQFYRQDLSVPVHAVISYATGQKKALFQQEIHGLDSFKMFWYKRMHDAPDQYCTLGHTIVKVRSDGTAMTRFQFQVKGNEVSDATRMNEEMLSALLIDEKLIVDEPSEAEVENILNLPDVSWEEDSSSPSEDDSTTPRASPVHMPYSSSFSSVFSTSDRVEELESVPHPITTSSSSSNKVRKHSTTSRAAEEEMLDPNLTLHDDIINDDVLPFLPTSNTTIEVERKLLREKQMKSSEIILVPYNLTGILTLQLDQEGKVYHVDVQAQLLDNFSNNRTDMAR